MKILFIIDRLELKWFEFNDLVTNFWLIREFIYNGHDVFITTIDLLSLQNKKPWADCFRTEIKDDNLIYDKTSSQKYCINDFNLVMFRPDPPVDMDYINATYIFDFVDYEKTLVLNNPCAIRDFNEKLHAVEFLDLMPENIVTASKKDILNFLEEHERIVLKPLNQCFGSGVMVLQKGDMNTSVIINQMTKNSSTLVMVQKYIEKAKFGDKRVMFLGDRVLEVCVQKLPGQNDFKFNDHCDKNIVKAVLMPTEVQKFTPVAKKLNSMGLELVGLDVIDEKIIEINVTSPCYFIREVNNHFGVHLEKEVAGYILKRAEGKILSPMINTQI
ncbi:hypothetical protein J6E39_06235 [bacterium]|nr:hypothetical protein [bacterium]